MDRKFLISIIILASVFLNFLDYYSGISVSFVIFYFLLIVFAVVYAGSPYSFVIAWIAALGRGYASYAGFTNDVHASIVIWPLIINLTVNTIFCYLLTIGLQIKHFLKPLNNPLLVDELASFPKIGEFIFRPYINRHWGMSLRLRTIETHYLLVKSKAPFLNLADDEFIEIAQLDIGNEKLRVTIDRPVWLRREGEIAFNIFYGIDRIYTAMTTLSGTPDNLKLIIGNFQGDGRDRMELYKAITKAMFGLRPRDLLLNIVKILASELGCKVILGISDDAHRSSHRFSKAKKLSAYDEIWLEQGGTKASVSGFFTMPARIEKRTDEEIPAKKRSMYRNRYQFLDDFQLEMKTLVSFPPQKKKSS